MNFQELQQTRPDLAFIAHWIDQGQHALDIGCGDGVMLDFLQSQKTVLAMALKSPTIKCSLAVRVA